MNATAHGAPDSYRRRYLAARGQVNGRSSRPVMVVGLALCISVAGCSSGRSDATPSYTSTPLDAASPTPSQAEQTLLLSQYRKFWDTLTPASRLPVTQRRALLAAVAVDPELKSLLTGMAAADAKGQVLYGRNVPRPTVTISPDAMTAVVDDCQNSSAAGVASKSTLSPVTTGVPRNHVVVTMKKPSGIWKVAFVSYTKTPC